MVKCTYRGLLAPYKQLRGGRYNFRRPVPGPMTNNVAGKKAGSRQQQAAPEEANAKLSTPLSLVVKDAVCRWFNDAQKEALKGDVKQQALVGQMLIEGYGCQKNPQSGKEWTDKANRRGYRMSGVYCEL